MRDVYDLWEANERRLERQLAALPVCDICGEPIQADHYYELTTACVCPDCIDVYRRDNW